MGEDRREEIPRGYAKNRCWGIMEDESDDACNFPSSSDSLGDSSASSSSSNMSDDATSSCRSTGSMYDLSELRAQLPIKRGLSKYYDGKSQSYTSLGRVTSLEDLAKKEARNYRRKMKASKSCGGGLDAHKSHTLPRPIISKKASRTSVLNSSFPARNGSLMLNRCKTTLVHLHKD